MSINRENFVFPVEIILGTTRYKIELNSAGNHWFITLSDNAGSNNAGSYFPAKGDLTIREDKLYMNDEFIAGPIERWDINEMIII